MPFDIDKKCVLLSEEFALINQSSDPEVIKTFFRAELS